MKEEYKSKEQLMEDLAKLRQENIELRLVLKDQDREYPCSECSLPGRWFSSGRAEAFVSNTAEPQQSVTAPIKHKYSELIDIPLVQQLMNSFYKATGIPYGLFDVDKNLLTGIGWQDICAKFHRICPQTEYRCKISDNYISKHLHDGSYIGYKCLNGLHDYATPIIVEGQHLATIFLGQLFHEPPDEHYFRRQAHEYGFDEAAYMEALRRVPIIPEDQIGSIMEFFSHLGRFLATMGLERKCQMEAAEQVIKEQQEKIYKAFQSNPDIMTITTLREGRYVEVNDAYVKITGYERNETIGRTVHDLDIWAVPEERERLLKQIQEHGSVQGLHIKLRLKSGEIRSFSLSGEIVEIDGEAHLINTCRDITERKQMEEALRLSEECLSKAFDASPIIMTITSLEEGRFIKVNSAFCHILGHSCEEAIGRTSLELGFWVDRTDRDRVQQSLMAEQSFRDTEIAFCNKAGEQRLGLYSAEIINIYGQPCIISILRDITELREMEIEIKRLDRLNLVGQIAASIGHEVRNPMTTVRGFLQIVKSKDYIQDVEWFDLMIEELDRANSIITEFLSLAKNKIVDMRPGNINVIIRKSLPLIQATAMSEDQYINLELDDLPDMLLDEKEIRQLIINLVNNGLEAMPAAGALSIKTFVEEENIVLAVQDQGHGIDRKLLDKLGTPFITTKEQGTGLGLSVCYRIANRHNAKITVDTSSTGTTFFVRFPIPIRASMLDAEII